MAGIIQAIALHKHVYERDGIEVPPFRISCKEHKELFEICKAMLAKGQEGGRRIAMYMGVHLELVINVEDYC